MSEILETTDELRAEIDRLQAELRRARREQAHTEQVARRSESLSLQSKRAMLRTYKELEQRLDELRGAKRAAEDSASMKARFLATMSHELRTPLNGMVGSAELLLGSGLNDEQAELVRLLQRSGQSLLAIVNDVLDYSRLEANGMPIECIPFRLEQCIGDVVELQRQVARDKGIELRTTWHPGVPAVVHGDPGRLRQVLMNLLTNAIKFTTQGRVEIGIRAGATPDEIAFAVSDTGIGIRKEVLPQLFEAFTQADASTARRFGGSGLGLAVCRRLVELMGGTIAAESVFGEGSTFTFTARLRAGQAHELREEIRPISDSRPEAIMRGRVLVVDDSESNRFILARMLARLGFECDEAVDGVDAAARAAGNDYRIVFMDCSMPVMDGFDATCVIRSMPGARGNVPIVALTAYSLPEDRARCEEVGMNDCLTKPLRLADLEVAVERLLR
ncbi:MAG: response regulator [Planctomycetes bacterium]|nr:response regulator [Planctomycetota bacterium]